MVLVLREPLGSAAPEWPGQHCRRGPVQREGEALHTSCWRVKSSPSSHSRRSNGREIVFHTVGGSGLGLGGFCWSCVWWAVGACLRCFQCTLTVSLTENAWALFPSKNSMLATFEEPGTVSSVSIWGIEYCFGFLCLDNRSVVILCYNRLLSFYFIYKFKTLPWNWYWQWKRSSDLWC